MTSKQKPYTVVKFPVIYQFHTEWFDLYDVTDDDIDCICEQLTGEYCEKLK